MLQAERKKAHGSVQATNAGNDTQPPNLSCQFYRLALG